MTMDAYRGRTLPITLRRAEKLRQGFFDDLSRAALASTALTERAAAVGPAPIAPGGGTPPLGAEGSGGLPAAITLMPSRRAVGWVVAGASRDGRWRRPLTGGMVCGSGVSPGSRVGDPASLRAGEPAAISSGSRARSSAPTRRLEQRERGASGGVLAVTGALRPQRLEGGALGRARAGGPGHRQGDSSEPIGRRGRPDRRDRPRPRHAEGRVIRGGDRSRIERLISELLEEL